MSKIFSLDSSVYELQIILLLTYIAPVANQDLQASKMHDSKADSTVTVYQV